MKDICSITGLPKELSVFDQIAQEGQRITVALESRKFGKKYTVIRGINEHDVDTKDLAKKLKSRLACGGTGRNGVVELQGDHLRNVKDELIALGFPPETIDVEGR
ncbi:translation initiation factor [Candidatus Woesearchaeota archaeon]|nr:MAG: translation initiation factor [Candidatus Woesearchaeota archaeon]